MFGIDRLPHDPNSTTHTGYFLGAKDFHPDSWDYWALPQVYTLAQRMGYTRALFCPYDSEVRDTVLYVWVEAKILLKYFVSSSLQNI